MTDTERQQLINSLINYKGYDKELNKLVHDAADEIKRLAAENGRLRKQQSGPNYVPIGGAGNGA